MWIERTLAPTLRQLQSSFPAILLFGPRQVGKTSLLERTFDDFTYVPLDVAGHAELAETRPDDFLRRFPPPLLLDEVQHAPAIFRSIKTAVDARRGENGRLVLTGSQDFTLMESVSDSSAGRAAVVPFLGLSAEEWAAIGLLKDGYVWQDFCGVAAIRHFELQPEAINHRRRACEIAGIRRGFRSRRR